jgi:uncharacterized membrane protein
MNFLSKNKLTFAGIALGATAGFLYYHFYGCTNGCRITSSPVNSSIYGAIMGGLILTSFKKENNKTTKL